MKFGTDVYGDYGVRRPHRESDRFAIEWWPFPSTWTRPAFIANLFAAPSKLGHWLSRKTGIGWYDE